MHDPENVLDLGVIQLEVTHWDHVIANGLNKCKIQSENLKEFNKNTRGGLNLRVLGSRNRMINQEAAIMEEWELICVFSADHGDNQKMISTR